MPVRETGGHPVLFFTLESPWIGVYIMATEAQNRANAAYRKKNVKQVCIRFYPSEAALLEYLDTKGGRASYLKKLLREDMERNA